jgi:hypothetical protein
MVTDGDRSGREEVAGCRRLCEFVADCGSIH